MAKRYNLILDPLGPIRRTKNRIRRNLFFILLCILWDILTVLYRIVRWVFYQLLPTRRLSYAGLPPVDPTDADAFYSSHAYRKWSTDVLARQRATHGYNFCVLCGTREGPFHSDHIKPRSTHPELALDTDNGQVLCEDHNMGKGNRYEQDWRG